MPSQIGELAAARVVVVAAGPSHSAFLCQDGALYTCGLLAYGRLGWPPPAPAALPLGAPLPPSAPRAVCLLPRPVPLPAGTRVLSVACGTDHTVLVCCCGTVNIVAVGGGGGGGDGSGGSGGSGGDCLGPGATGATFSCDTSDEGAIALVDTRHGCTALRRITRERHSAEAESSVVRRTEHKHDNARGRGEEKQRMSPFR